MARLEQITDWRSALVFAGIPDEYLTGKGCPCPLCGGTDRFTFDNKYGKGNWVCRKCNGGHPRSASGVDLVMDYFGIDFLEAKKRLLGESSEQLLPKPIPVSAPAMPAPKKKPDPAYSSAKLNKLWNEAKPVTRGDPVANYLEARLPGYMPDKYPSSLRYHPRLPYWEKVNGELKEVGCYPAMLAKLIGPDGKAVTIQKTYLDPKKPQKASVEMPKKTDFCQIGELVGAVIWLDAPVNGVMGIAEGIETALAAGLLNGVPTSAATTRAVLAGFVPPSDVHTVYIFADWDSVDEHGISAGMQAALDLAKRLKGMGLKVFIKRPKVKDQDFADEYVAMSKIISDLYHKLLKKTRRETHTA
jgi:putative DNA primase/helicase